MVTFGVIVSCATPVKSVPIEDGRGLLTCMAYVELNCVRAGLCNKPLIDGIDVGEIAGLVLRRTRWMIDRFSLQTGRYNGPRPFELDGGLFNSR